MSLNGKRARGGQVHIHTTGAHSFAWKRDEQMVLYNEEPNDVVFFGLAHTTLEGSFVTEAFEKFMAKAKKELSRKTKAIGGSEPVDHEVEAEIARDIIKKLRPRGVTGHGAGVKKSQVTKFGIECKRMRGEAISSEKRFLLDKVDFESVLIAAISPVSSMMLTTHIVLGWSLIKAMVVRETLYDDFLGERDNIDEPSNESSFVYNLLTMADIAQKALNILEALVPLTCLYDVRPSENHLIEHTDFIREAVKRDATLAKSKVSPSLVVFRECIPDDSSVCSRDAFPSIVIAENDLFREEVP
ncbi:ribose 5-phosphate isomerase A [Tanacetum coccineum]